MSTSISASTSPIDIKTLLVEFDSSGQSAAAFARSRGLAPWKLYWALQRRSGKVRARRVVASAQSNALLPVRIVDAKPTSQRTGVELVLAGGHRVVLEHDFDAPTLRRLLEALAAC